MALRNLGMKQGCPRRDISNLRQGFRFSYLTVSYIVGSNAILFKWERAYYSWAWTAFKMLTILG